MTYQPPVLEEVGSVRELTLTGKSYGHSDYYVWRRKDDGGGGMS
ncbi:lasso RiPP family leader peptide-containing protein [Phytoactinopolyspora halotolerans]|uniref:Lasso RiPP family leader peptide-containing protein n=1 Tax=Phytoactinopolyspora halotolerans TaxID=1981512 RepID=A0A6L9S321_9ACTN|nr:lasso RiPP family leader peptide-containing protein [Phytoactinopolyspora halotolerans]NED99595.1 lasso RiPP family leader peptide-containing protein [Phytoactinopolyspora halotolerans]